MDDRQAAILIWNYHDDDLPALASPVTIEVSGLPEGPVLLQHYRVDTDHSNSYTAWKKMGSPKNPTSSQYAELEKADQLELLDSPKWVQSERVGMHISVELPRQAVSLITFSW